MPVVWSRAQGRLDQILSIMCSWRCLLELRWSETARFVTPGISVYKIRISVYKIRICYLWILDAALLSLPPLAGHGGEGKRKDRASICGSRGRRGPSSSLACRRLVRLSPLSDFAALPRWEVVRSASAASSCNNKRPICLLFSGGQSAPMLLLVGPGGEGEEQAVVGLATKQRRRLGSPCAQHALTVIVVAIFGRSSGLISTSATEVFGSVAGARHAQETKWFVPGVLVVAGGGIQSSENSLRAVCSLILAAELRGRRRSGGGVPAVLDCFFQSSFRVFSAKKKGLILK